MKRTVIMLTLALAVGIAVGMIGAQLLNAQQEPVKRTPLFKTDLAGMAGKEGLLIHVELAPGAAAGKHHHPGHEFIYVLEGSGSWEEEGKPPLILKAGDTRYLAPKQVHDVKNNSRTAALKLLDFVIHEKGQPVAVPVK